MNYFACYRKHSMAGKSQEYNQGRERLRLSLSLFIIMGGLWTFEVVVSCKNEFLFVTLPLFTKSKEILNFLPKAWSVY